MIKSNSFLTTFFLTILALNTKRKKCGQMGATPCYSESQVVLVCQSFRPVAQFFFSSKVLFFFFFSMERGVAT